VWLAAAFGFNTVANHGGFAGQYAIGFLTDLSLPKHLANILGKEDTTMKTKTNVKAGGFSGHG
jgi:hypothetical protein